MNTIRSVAKRIVQPGQDLDTLVERLRNLASCGILSPSGKKNPGTGRSRKFSEYVVVKAALINEIMPIRLTPTHTHASIFPLKQGERR